MRQPADRVIGCEYEALIQGRNGSTVPYDGPNGIKRCLEYLRDHFDWNPICEEEYLIALERDSRRGDLTRPGGIQSVTLEPGGQFEMSGAPLARLAHVQSELEAHVEELKQVEDDLGVRARWFGLNPWQSTDEIQWMPKQRYGVMKRYLPTQGRLAHYMMGLTCTVQCNLDYTDEADFAFKLKMSTGVSPLVNALFANSPIYSGKNTGWKSYRSRIWHEVDPARCGLHRFVFDTDAGFDDYIEWALDIPMFFVVRDGIYVDMTNRGTFRDLKDGRISGMKATLADWKLHLSTLFPEVRARPHLEFRSADVVPPNMINSCPALWVGLVYDENAAQYAWDLVKGFSFSERLDLWSDCAHYALEAPIPGRRGHVFDLANDLVQIAQEGLKNLSAAGLGDANDEQFLAPLREILANRRTRADRILAGEIRI